MKFKTLLTATLLSSFAVPALAATVEYDPDGGAAGGTYFGLTSTGGCTASVLTPEANQCFGVMAGNNMGNSAPGEALVAAFLSGAWGITASGVSDETPTDASADPGYQIDLGSLVSGPFAIGLKQANGFSLYYYNSLSTQYVTFVDNDGFGGNGNVDISHWTLYGGGGTTVPEPTSLALLGLGLAGLGLARRRRS